MRKLLPGGVKNTSPWWKYKKYINNEIKNLHINTYKNILIWRSNDRNGNKIISRIISILRRPGVYVWNPFYRGRFLLAMLVSKPSVVSILCSFFADINITLTGLLLHRIFLLTFFS